MRERIFHFLNRKSVIVVFLVIYTAITLSIENYSYFFGMIVLLVTLWASRWNWQLLGIWRLKWLQTIGRALLFSVLIFLVVDGLITPFVELYFQPLDLSSFDWLKGNWAGYLIFTLFMWVFAAIGEEVLYRGYIMKQIASLFGEARYAPHAGAVLSSVLFGLGHLYQGASGVILTGTIGLILAYVFLANPKNLTLTMLIHGFYDMIGLTILFLDKETAITDWVEKMLS